MATALALKATWWETLNQRTRQAKPRPLTHRHTEIVNVCCFKSLSVEVISHAVIDHLYNRVLKASVGILE